MMSNSACSLLQQGPVTPQIISTVHSSFRDYCQRVLNVFEQAYVGKDQCEVPMEAYDPLVAIVNLDHPCNQVYVIDSPKQAPPINIKMFASYACGEVTAMLNGGNTEPFDPGSILALEIKNLRRSFVTHLNVVLINGDESRCNSSNLQTLRTELKEKEIAFNCKKISGHNIKKCIASTSRPCGACLFQ
ncbi:hypothetical protein INR49_012055 [Caranx melampygus]|nr:hypothetical protein INR49_012055 [Caranx melampygus]